MVFPKLFEYKTVYNSSPVVNYREITSPAEADTFGVNTNSYIVVAPAYLRTGVTCKDVCW